MSAIRKFVPAGLAMALVVLYSGACDTATGLGGPAINISATWQVEGDPSRAVDFRSPDDGNRRGVLTGREEIDFGNIENPLGGFWADGRIEITINRGGQLPRFVATFHEADPTRLTFTSSTAESFTVIR
jgi:hypothetical protein